jgi:predicted RNA-binding Zn-ribbon protein involved in translation (DUF1610 family)
VSVVERTRVCVCGEHFTPRDGRQKHHSPRCGNLERVRRHRHPEAAPWEPPELTREIDDALALTKYPEHALLAVLARRVSNTKSSRRRDLSSCEVAA